MERKIVRRQETSTPASRHHSPSTLLYTLVEPNYRYRYPKMPPRLNLFAARAIVPVFRQPTTPQRSIASAFIRSNAAPCTQSGAQRRWNSSGSDDKKKLEEAQHAADPLPHVSQEAAEINNIMDKEKRCDGTPSSPELEQGTMVSEVCIRRRQDKTRHLYVSVLLGKAWILDLRLTYPCHADSLPR